MLGQPLFLSGCSSIQLFNSLLLLIGYHPTPLVTTLISFNLHKSRDTIRRHWTTLSFPIQYLPREADDFPSGGKYPKHVPLPIYLATSHQKVLLGRFHLCVRVCHRTLYKPLASFGITF